MCTHPSCPLYLGQSKYGRPSEQGVIKQFRIFQVGKAMAGGEMSFWQRTTFL